jgi:hypothetical protein
MIVRLIQNLSNLRQGKSQLPCFPGKSKPPEILGIKLLVVILRVTGRFQQVLAGVEPNRIRVNAGGFCNLFYFHRLVLNVPKIVASGTKD